MYVVIFMVIYIFRKKFKWNVYIWHLLLVLLADLPILSQMSGYMIFHKFIGYSYYITRKVVFMFFAHFLPELLLHCCWISGVSYICWILIICQMCDLQTCFPVQLNTFHVISLQCRSFLVYVIPFLYFLFYCCPSNVLSLKLLFFAMLETTSLFSAGSLAASGFV